MRSRRRAKTRESAGAPIGTEGTVDNPIVTVSTPDLQELAVELADMRRLHEMSTRLVGIGDLTALLDEILNVAIDLQGADFGKVQLHDATTATMKIVARKGLVREFPEHFSRADADGDAVGDRAMKTLERVIVEDVENDPLFAPHRAIASHLGYRAVQSTPIIARDGTIKGMLSTYFRQPYRPAERDLRLTDLHLRMAAELIERAQAQEATEAARRAAERANQAKSRFLAAASHDLRQPLTTIGLLHGILERRALDPEARATLVQLDDAITNMTEMLDALLDINEIETGAITPDITDFPVRSALERAAKEFAPVAAVKGLRLRSVPSSSVIRSDGRLIARIIDNLLSNAIKHSDHGKVLLGCRRRGDELRVEVWDTGITIAPEGIDAVFNESYRTDRSDVARPGTGLGLYTVKRLAELLGHTVEVRSTPPKGTMFALTVPCGASAGAASGTSGRMADAEGSRPAILLVEDDPGQRTALGTLLELEGYRVASVGKCEEALVQLSEPGTVPPDIVIADYGSLPGIDGLETIRRVQAHLGARIPALILSGDKSVAALKVLKATGHDYIYKPAKSANLLHTVEALIRRVKPEWSAKSKHRPAAASALPSAVGFDVAIVDDEPSVCDSLRMVLEADGYSVSIYASGEEFLADAKHDRFRCLVVDLTLRGMNGLELHNRIKSEGLGIPVIFVTGAGSLSMAVSAMREGAADFLQKPVHSEQLCESVRRVLKSGGHGVDLPREPDDIAADLGISRRTVEHHRHNMMRKLGVKSLAMLARMVTLNARVG